MVWGALTDETMQLLERSLTYRTRNQEVISANIANLDTPSYTGKQMESFQKVLDSYNQGIRPVALSQTDPRHLGAGKPRPAGLVEDSGNGVDLDREIVGMSENQLAYQASVQMLIKKLDSIRTAIGTGGN